MENKGLVKEFRRTYCFYTQKFVAMTKSGAYTELHSYSDKVIESHLEGKYALCVFSGPKVTRFLSVDVDSGGKRAVRKVINAFVELGIPKEYIHVSMSGSKGYHVDIFFNPWLYLEKSYNLYNLMIWRTGLDPKKVEFKPTAGGSIKIPLGVHQKTGKRCWFVDRDTLEPIESFDYIREIEPLNPEILFEILRVWNKKHWNEMYTEMICEDTGHDMSIGREIEFNDEYYESKRLRDPGTRHNTMIEIARDLRTYGANQFQIIKALKGFYYRQDHQLIGSSEREVLKDIREIAQWAEEFVAVRKNRQVNNENTVHKIALQKEDAESIIRGATPMFRRIALLIYSYCKMFGACHASYEYIGKVTGSSLATIKKASKFLVTERILSKKSGGCHYYKGQLTRSANTYFIPHEVKDRYSDQCYEYNGYINKETIDDIYYGVMMHFFSMEELKQHMTKPELAECERRMRDGAEGADPDA